MHTHYKHSNESMYTLVQNTRISVCVKMIFLHLKCLN